MVPSAESVGRRSFERPFTAEMACGVDHSWPLPPLVLSHDRWFLDRVVTHLLAFERNFQAYIEDLKKRKGPDADQPHRIAYKLVRA